MKATEHRLGNLIYNPIQKEVVTLVAIEQGNRPITLGKRGTSSFSGFTCLEPIPLTEEWLLKFVKIQWISKDINGIFYWFNGEKKYLKFVHSLQNMYFCIEQKELQESIKKNLPQQVGEILKQRLEQADEDAKKAEELASKLIERNEEVEELEKIIRDYKQFDVRNVEYRKNIFDSESGMNGATDQ